MRCSRGGNSWVGLWLHYGILARHQLNHATLRYKKKRYGTVFHTVRSTVVVVVGYISLSISNSISNSIFYFYFYFPPPIPSLHQHQHQTRPAPVLLLPVPYVRFNDWHRIRMLGKAKMPLANYIWVLRLRLPNAPRYPSIATAAIPSILLPSSILHPPSDMQQAPFGSISSLRG